MNRVMAGAMAGFVIAVALPHAASAEEVVSERHDTKILQMISPQEGRRLQDIPAAREGRLWVTGGLSSTPCVAGPASAQSNQIQVDLTACGEGNGHTGVLPVEILWRRAVLQPWLSYPVRSLSDGNNVLRLPTAKRTDAPLLHLMVSYE